MSIEPYKPLTSPSMGVICKEKKRGQLGYKNIWSTNCERLRREATLGVGVGVGVSGGTPFEK